MTALRVLVCEDSRVYGVALRRMLEYDGDIDVLGVCGTAQEAMAALSRVEPDLITMDIELPGMNGLDAVGEIMSSRPLPILVLSSYVGPASDLASAVLAAGALDAFAKDELDLDDPAGTAGAAFRHRVRVLSQTRVIRHPGPGLTAGPGVTGLAHRASVVGVCSSVGGPQMLMFLLQTLPPDYPVPLLIVQHMAAGFTGGLGRWLDRAVAIPVGTAADGMPARPGAWLAPHGAHLSLTGTGQLALDRHTAAGHHRPSGDVLLGSIADNAGKAGVAVVLTGMGSDGAAGAAAVRRRGGLAIAQNEESSVVFGMPKAAINLGVDVVLSPGDIAACLLRLRHEPLPEAR